MLSFILIQCNELKKYSERITTKFTKFFRKNLFICQITNYRNSGLATAAHEGALTTPERLNGVKYYSSTWRRSSTNLTLTTSFIVRVFEVTNRYCTPCKWWTTIVEKVWGFCLVVASSANYWIIVRFLQSSLYYLSQKKNP